MIKKLLDDWKIADIYFKKNLNSLIYYIIYIVWLS